MLDCKNVEIKRSHLCIGEEMLDWYFGLPKNGNMDNNLDSLKPF